jgi:hypothetical protein
LGFAWCYDAESGNSATIADPVYGVKWHGNSVAGPEGDLEWGLDAGDITLTGNSVCMDTYLSVTQGYINYCTANSIPTKVFFTTGPVDGYSNSEIGYQAYLKWEYLRAYVKAEATRILFDYADILCYDDNGKLTTNTWNGHIYPYITATNIENGAHNHIGVPGEIRIAKALWWLLARIAGWDGGGAPTGMKDDEQNVLGGLKIKIESDVIPVSISDGYLYGQIGLHDISGHIINIKNINENMTYLNTALLSSGLYFIVISKGNKREVRKLIL